MESDKPVIDLALDLFDIYSVQVTWNGFLLTRIRFDLNYRLWFDK